MFLLSSYKSTPAIDEANRRSFQVEILWQRYPFDAWVIRQGLKVIREYQINILESHGTKPAFVAWCLKRVTGIPWIAYAHGYTSENRRMAIYNQLDRWLMRQADRVVSVSQATGDRLQDAGVPKERIRVIHNAIDPLDYDLMADGAEFRRECGTGLDNLLIGVVGRLSPEKGQHVFIRAFQDVAKAVPEVKAVLVGDGSERENLEAAVCETGLKDRVQFVGYRFPVSSVYAAMDLVVIPSLSEGLPFVLLEAMLHKKAVVTTAVGGIPEVMQGELSQLLVPPGDPGALAQAMIQALRDASFRSKLGDAGSRLVQDAYSPVRRAEKIYQLYSEMLDGRSGRVEYLRA